MQENIQKGLPEFMLESGGDLVFYVFFGLLVLLIGCERLVPKRQQPAGQARRWVNNAGLTILAILAFPLVPISFLTAAFWAQEQGYGLLNYVVLPMWALVVLTLLMRGFVSFFTHFLNHQIPFLWRLHRVHHMDTELDVSSTVRAHPLEIPLSSLIGLPIVVGFGLSPWVLIFYELIDAATVLFSHSNIRIPPRLNRYLQYVIVTPDLHKIHHSSYQPETDSNYSAVFPIWDQIFRTFRTETRQPLETMQIGLEDVRDPKANNFWWLLISPVVSLNGRSLEPLAQPAD